jgi:hypothetical protein
MMDNEFFIIFGKVSFFCIFGFYVLGIVGTIGMRLEKWIKEREMRKLKAQSVAFWDLIENIKTLGLDMLKIRSDSLKSKSIETKEIEMDVLGGKVKITYTFDGTKDE